MTKIVIIGGGIVGLATALALTEAGQTNVLVLEAEATVAQHQTGHNSGVIHSGLYYKPGSQKARTCTEGRELLYDFCARHDIPHERCGKVVVATSGAEIPRLKMLAERGRANGLTGLRWLAGAELAEYEPHISGVAGLWVPQTGIVDYSRVAQTYAHLIEQAGAEIRRGWRVVGCRREGAGVVLETTRGTVQAERLVNCAGLFSDRVARLCGVEPGVQIVPFRGEYYELKPAQAHRVKNLVYPVPDPRFPFLGVHFTRMIGGGVEAGPNAVLAFQRTGYRKLSFSVRDTLEFLRYPGFWRLASQHWQMGLGEFYRSLSQRAFVTALQKLMPSLSIDDVTPAGAGVRAQALAPDGRLIDDFHIVSAPGMLHVLNAPSPAATASLSIGRQLARRVLAM